MLFRSTLCTPYTDVINHIEADYFAANGFPVVNSSGLALELDRDIARLEPEDAEAQVARTDVSEADCIFISCTDYHVLDAIDRIESRQRKPVVTSNQAGAWGALRMMGIEESIPGAGKLLTLPYPSN